MRLISVQKRTQPGQQLWLAEQDFNPAVYEAYAAPAGSASADVTPPLEAVPTVRPGDAVTGRLRKPVLKDLPKADASDG